MAMTVKDVKEFLADLDDNLLVVMSSDGEGNKISPLSDISVGKYEADGPSKGEYYDDEPEEDDDYERDGVDVACFWPVN